MKFQQIRHATHLLHYHGKTILVDPVFSLPGTMPPIPNAPNPASNPLTELPVPVKSLLNYDLLMITHMHSDHFDEAASNLLNKELPLICPPHDKQALEAKQFNQCIVIQESIVWSNIEIFRTGGTHGTGPSATLLNPVSGFVLKAPGEPTVYITGDTVWCPELNAVLASHRPDIIIAYAGAALYMGDTITIDIPDLQRIRDASPTSKLIVIHSESWNHCGLNRDTIRQWAYKTGQEPNVWVPEDGESILF